MKPGERQAAGAALVQKPEHAAQEILRAAGGPLAADDVQPPEGEEHRDLHAHRGRAGGDDEGRHHAVEIPAQDDESHPVGLALLKLCQRHGRLKFCGTHTSPHRLPAQNAANERRYSSMRFFGLSILRPCSGLRLSGAVKKASGAGATVVPMKNHGFSCARPHVFKEPFHPSATRSPA